ncbi:MAG: CHRD domain-containing protein [Gemmatimonadota bacterium]
MKKTLYAVLMILATAAFVAGAAEARGMSHGQQVVKVKLVPLPKVTAKEGGEADFTLAKDGETLRYVLRGRNVADVTMAHVHEVAADGTPGAIIAWLYPTTGEAPSLKAGKTTGIVAEGSIAAVKLGGPLKGGTVKDLYARIEEGKAGVAIHTKENPGGELWGFHKVGGHAKHAMGRRHAKKTT